MLKITQDHSSAQALCTNMSLAVVHSRALIGLKALPMVVEVHLANGLPSFTLVGLAETEVKESRERVRAALLHSGLDFPHNKRITVNLAPADLPKEGGRFDLPIALGILAASGQIDAERLEGFEFAGELSLAGELRAVRGALAMAVALKPLRGSRTLVLPPDSAREAALVPGLNPLTADHLLEVVNAFRAGDDVATLKAAEAPARAQTQTRFDMRDVRGQAMAKRALEVAAAGGHSALLVGPPGTGKSMLAQRFAGLLPAMSEDEALESAALLSLAGQFDPKQWGERRLRTPHHSASAVALVGGGSPPRPGEISLAHHGTLFLDEFAEHSRSALESLREPLESGTITISRAARQAEFPARFQLIAAMNPCPCGHLGSRLKACRCTPDAIARYQGRISGPLLDRIDLRVEVQAVSPEELARSPDGQPSTEIAERVRTARALALQRQGCVNAQLETSAMDEHAQLEASAVRFLQSAASQLGWSGRSYHRVVRVARTLADLAQQEVVGVSQIAEAIQLRRVLPSS